MFPLYIKYLNIKEEGGLLHGLLPFQMPFAAAAAKSLQSSLTLCDPIDGSPPGSPVPGILLPHLLRESLLALHHKLSPSLCTLTEPAPSFRALASFVIRHSLASVLEKAMAPHSSTLAWKIPWMEEPGGLQSMGSLRVGHNCATSLSLFTFMHWRMSAQSRTRLMRLSSSSSSSSTQYLVPFSGNF